jgi:hypothetical protein
MKKGMIELDCMELELVVCMFTEPRLGHGI